MTRSLGKRSAFSKSTHAVLGYSREATRFGAFKQHISADTHASSSYSSYWRTDGHLSRYVDKLAVAVENYWHVPIMFLSYLWLIIYFIQLYVLHHNVQLTWQYLYILISVYPMTVVFNGCVGAIYDSIGLQVCIIDIKPCNCFHAWRVKRQIKIALGIRCVSARVHTHTAYNWLLWLHHYQLKKIIYCLLLLYNWKYY